MTVGALRDAGNDGYIWTGTPLPTTSSAYYLHFNSGIIYPVHNANRWIGFTVWAAKPYQRTS